MLFIYSDQKNSHIKIAFNLKDSGDYIVAIGRIAWVKPFMRGQKDINYVVGIEFIELEEEDRKKIADCISHILKDVKECI